MGTPKAIFKEELSDFPPTARVYHFLLVITNLLDLERVTAIGAKGSIQAYIKIYSCIFSTKFFL